ncbi:MAG: 50S ribosomal protein L23 [Planctomycetes bacterium]|nr:50S ribosomal protein L23 [Planctomycetota bacterium]
MNREIHKILLRPILTEKVVTAGQESNAYAFEVAGAANKIEIRKAVEQAFKVKVLKVRTARARGGTRRFGYRSVKRPAVKRAYVTLAEGDRIDLL